MAKKRQVKAYVKMVDGDEHYISPEEYIKLDEQNNMLHFYRKTKKGRMNGRLNLDKALECNIFQDVKQKDDDPEEAEQKVDQEELEEELEENL